MGKIKIDLFDELGNLKESKEYTLEQSETTAKGIFDICNLVEKEESEKDAIKNSTRNLKKSRSLGFIAEVKGYAKNILSHILKIKNDRKEFEIHYDELGRIIKKRLYFSAKDKNYTLKSERKTYLRTNLINHIILYPVKVSFELLKELGILEEYIFEYVPIQNSYVIKLKIAETDKSFENTIEDYFAGEVEGIKLTDEMIVRIKKEYTVDYNSIVERIKKECANDYQATATQLEKILPDYWFEKYDKMTGNDNILLIPNIPGFTFAFDLQAEIGGDVDDRVVAAYGFSKISGAERDEERIGGLLNGVYNLKEQNIDRGHFVAHSIGGNEDGMNLFFQDVEFNRGWSEEGKIYRAMETYCSKNEGTFCFTRPIYMDRSSLVYMLEYGVLKKDGEIWVELFKNV